MVKPVKPTFLMVQPQPHRQALSERSIVHEKAGDLWEVSMGVQRRNLRGNNIVIIIYIYICYVNDMYNYI